MKKHPLKNKKIYSEGEEEVNIGNIVKEEEDLIRLNFRVKKKDRLFGKPTRGDVIIRVERVVMIGRGDSGRNTIVIIKVMIGKVTKERKALKFSNKENSLKSF